jgi:hypothetical protein
LSLVASHCVPRLLPAIDDHMLARTVRDKITRSEDRVIAAWKVRRRPPPIAPIVD